MNNYKVVIEGFPSKEAAEHFFNWYLGMGEQDIVYYAEEHAPDVDFSVKYNDHLKRWYYGFPDKIVFKIKGKKDGDC